MKPCRENSLPNVVMLPQLMPNIPLTKIEEKRSTASSARERRGHGKREENNSSRMIRMSTLPPVSTTLFVSHVLRSICSNEFFFPSLHAAAAWSHRLEVLFSICLRSFYRSIIRGRQAGKNIIYVFLLPSSLEEIAEFGACGAA